MVVAAASSSSPRRSSRIAKAMKRSHSTLPPPTTATATAKQRPRTRSRSMDTKAGVDRLLQKRRKTATTGTSNCNDSARAFTIDDDNLLRHIFSFVGDHQYRFVGGVNRSFQKAYVTLFPDKMTHLKASSISLTKLCWDDIEATLIDESDLAMKDDNRRTLWYSAARHGSIEVAKHLLTLFRRLKHKPVCDDYDDIRRSDKWRVDWKYKLCCKAAEYGHLHLLQWACDQKVYVSKSDYRVCENALGNGHIEILNWAMHSGFELAFEYLGDAARMATENGHLEALKWIHSIGYDFNGYDDDAILDERTVWCDIAVEFGHLEIIKWFHTIGSGWGENSINSAIKFDQMEALRFMLDHGCRSYTLNSCKSAAINGNLVALQMLRSVDCPWDDTVPAFAAVFGHVDLIEWAISNSCPWSESTCLFAAAFGTLEALKWLHAKGCPWDEGTTTCASTDEMYDWAVRNGCPVAPGSPRLRLQGDD